MTKKRITLTWQAARRPPHSFDNDHVALRQAVIDAVACYVLEPDYFREIIAECAEMEVDLTIPVPGNEVTYFEAGGASFLDCAPIMNIIMNAAGLELGDFVRSGVVQKLTQLAPVCRIADSSAYVAQYPQGLTLLEAVTLHCRRSTRLENVITILDKDASDIQEELAAVTASYIGWVATNFQGASPSEDVVATLAMLIIAMTSVGSLGRRLSAFESSGEMTVPNIYHLFASVTQADKGDACGRAIDMLGSMPIPGDRRHNFADISATNSVGNAPLHVAAMNGVPEIVAALLHCGADIGAKGRLGRTPAQIAQFYGQSEIASMLLAWESQLMMKAIAAAANKHN